MRSAKLLTVVGIGVVFSVMAGACGGGGGGKTSGPTAPAATSQAGKTPTAGVSPQAQAGSSDLSGLAGKFASGTFKVTYQVSGFGAAGSQGTMIWYKKGDNLRMDMTGLVPGQQGTTTMIMGSDTTYICTASPGVGTGGICLSSPSQAGQGAGQIASQLGKTLADPSLNVVSTSSRSIAGQDAKCYTVQSASITGQAEFCMSSDGAPLSVKETVQGSEMTMEATDYSSNVSDSDFQPPYPVSAMPGGAGNPQE